MIHGSVCRAHTHVSTLLPVVMLRTVNFRHDIDSDFSHAVASQLFPTRALWLRGSFSFFPPFQNNPAAVDAREIIGILSRAKTAGSLPDSSTSLAVYFHDCDTDGSMSKQIWAATLWKYLRTSADQIIAQRSQCYTLAKYTGGIVVTRIRGQIKKNWNTCLLI